MENDRLTKRKGANRKVFGRKAFRMPTLVIISLIFFVSCQTSNPYKELYTDLYAQYSGKTPEYPELMDNYISGWNTWNTRSMSSFVFMPESFSLNLELKEYSGGWIMKEPLIGIDGVDGRHKRRTADGSYTDVELDWYGYSIRIQSAKTGEDDIVVLVTPLSNERVKDPALLVGGSFLWNRPGSVTIEDNKLKVNMHSSSMDIFVTGEPFFEPYTYTHFPSLAISLNEEVGISSGIERTLDEIRQIMTDAENAMVQKNESFESASEIAEISNTMFGWLTVYDPWKNRIFTPDSRRWNYWNGGYAIFVWEMYPLGYTASALGLKEIAYANIIEQTREILPNGMMPNYATPSFITHDRSMPPVGSMFVWEVYQKYGDKWLLEEVFENLLAWNEWWVEYRMHEGLLAYGSNAYEPITGNDWEKKGVHDRFGAALESGLDNSPMYDDIPFDKEKSILKLWDVGLNSLYIADNHFLALMAEELGKNDIAERLRNRKEQQIQNIEKLLDPADGVYKNKRWDNGEFQEVISPTVFYPLIAGLYTQEQAEKVIEKYFFNPDVFWGEWIMPSVARNHPTFEEQNYWRGRIWSALNFYCYLGFKNYDLPEATKALVEKSEELLVKNWIEKNHIYENYHALTGTSGDSASNSDPFYNWAILLGSIKLVENGHIAHPAIDVNNNP
jgi:hypothetical protein